MNKQTRIVLADDYPLLLESFALMLANEQGIEIVGQVANGEQLLNSVEAERPDVVITDIEMPVMNGLEAARIIKERFPATGLLALTMFNDHHLIVDMMEAGANGYLLKQASKEELLAAITAAKNGLQYFSNDTSMRLFKQLAKSKLQQEEETVNFTEKEEEIIRLICEQYASKEIAALTQLSKRTVDKYRDHIMQKTKSINLAGVVIYAIRHGYFKP